MASLGRVSRFFRPTTRPPGPRSLPEIGNPASRFGALGRDIRAIRHTGSSIGISEKSCQRDYLAAVYPDVGHRRYSGIKYYRITGRENKEYYRRDWAMGAADAHANHFLQSRVQQIEQLREMLPVEPIVLSPFDAELFGHWWFEGPEFLDLFLRKAAYDQKVFQLTTPSSYLFNHPTLQMVSPSPSSWGNKGYWEVWLDPCNSWIYPHLHAGAARMTEMARQIRQDALEVFRSAPQANGP